MTPETRQYYLDLAKGGARFPIGTDLVLREKPGHASIVLDGEKLGRVVEESAKRWKTQLAIPLMDLTLEKEYLLWLMGLPVSSAATHHFSGIPDGRLLDTLEKGIAGPVAPRLQAAVDAVKWVSQNTGLVPAGLAIGPFSLMVKLLEDAIPAVYMAGTGMGPDDDDDVAALVHMLELCTRVVLRSVEVQLEAGARLIVIAEPAGSAAYISPKQIEAGSDIFDRLVIRHNQRIAALVASRGAHLFFHCCGELCEPMVRQYGKLRMTMFSFGASRKLWEDAALIDKDIVIYGNLPTKKFISDELTVDGVRAQAKELLERMKSTGHPFVLGSECDVLSVTGKEKILNEKVEAFLSVKS
jgi:uroporphyrinogen-III decarboxylase